MLESARRRKSSKKRGTMARMSRKTEKKARGGDGALSTSVSKRSPARGGSPQQSRRKIKRDSTKEMFPSLAIENTAQSKLYKLAESISGFAKEVEASKQEVVSPHLQHRLEELKREHFKDLRGSSPEGTRPQDTLSTEKEDYQHFDFVNNWPGPPAAGFVSPPG